MVSGKRRIIGKPEQSPRSSLRVQTCFSGSISDDGIRVWFSSMAYRCYLWLFSDYMFTQVSVTYAIGSFSVALDGECDRKTKALMRNVFSGVRKALDGSRLVFAGEFCPGAGLQRKNKYKLSDFLAVTEEVLVSINDVIPILHVFSTYSDVKTG